MVTRYCAVILVIVCAECAGQTNSGSSSQAGLQSSSATAANATVQQGSISSPPGVGSTFRVAEGSLLHVVLVKPLDARKNKTGDEVATRIDQDLKSNGKLLIPKGSKVIGHLTQVQARGKEKAQSQLAITFDRLALRDGTEIPLNASIQTIAPPVTAFNQEDEDSTSGSAGMASPSGSGTMSSGGMGRAGAGAATGATGTLNRTLDRTSGAYGAGSASTEGVVGIRGVLLSTKADSADGSMISSDHQNVHLDSGTQLILRVNAK